MGRTSWVIGVVALALSLPALAVDGAAAPSGLALALEQAWRLHPQSAALEAREAEARAALEVATGWTPEPGSVSFGSLNDRLNRNRGRQEWEIELATPLWLPGQKAARELDAAARVNAAAAQRAALRLELAGEVREAWWALATARNAEALATRRMATARALAADVLRRYQAGDLSKLDANLAQTETLAAETELIEIEAARQQAEQALRVLTGVLPAAAGVAADFCECSNLSPFSAFSSDHPLLAAATAAAHSARARLKVADESRRAAPELALRLVQERGDFAEPYSSRVGIKLKIPFSAAPQVRRETSAAQAEADQAEAAMHRLEARIRLDAERAQRAVDAAERQFELARQRQELVSENLRLGEKAFALGETDLATLLKSRASAFDADSFFERQRLARALAISRLNQALGVLP